MAQKNVSGPVMAAIIVVVVLLAGVVLFRGATGGTVGTGEPGKVLAAPPGQDKAAQR